MKIRLLLFFLIISSCVASVAQTQRTSVEGCIRSQSTGEALTGVIIRVADTYMWGVSDGKGNFRIDNLGAGEHHLEISYLGYVTHEIVFDSNKDIEPLTIWMQESTLAVEQVEVLSQSNRSELTTTYKVGREALNHMQISDVTSITSLLPGGKSTNPDLTSDSRLSLRAGANDSGNASFGTAVEVDGVRMSNNSSFSALSGVSIRSVAVDNIESVEVITGIPSVEYGDINSGVVRIKSKRGESPLSVSASTNPRTYQLSLSQGVRLGEQGGALNVGAEWARATNNLVSPYDSYTRQGLSLIYSNSFGSDIRFESGVSLNFGGSNSEDDPDAFSGEYSIGKDNNIRANSSIEWLANSPYATNLKFDVSLNYHDLSTHSHNYNSYASNQPAVYSTQEGYFIANQLDYTFYADKYVESKELNLSASLKYELSSEWADIKGRTKAGAQWKTSGNIGAGEYYGDALTAPSGYRPRPYTSYPFMHNLSLYAEHRISVPLGETTLVMQPGLRVEGLFMDGSNYNNRFTYSPRINGEYRITKALSLRGGWGVTEKLPSFYVLFPDQEYRDILSFGATYNNNEAIYSYFTQPYSLIYNADLKWQRNYNSEVGVDFSAAGFKVGLTAFRNKTVGQYQYVSDYTPFSYNVYELPDNYEMPTLPEFKVDAQTGLVSIRPSGSDATSWTDMALKVTDETYMKRTYADNGADVVRSGLELVVDMPEIKPLRTKIRLDASYTDVRYLDGSLYYSYRSGSSHTSLANRSYQYVGIYANGGGSSTSNGRITKNLDANLTFVTHIPEARLIITCRVESSLYRRSQNLSEYNGAEYAFNVGESGSAATGGSIYDGDSFTMIYPVKYMTLDGEVHDFTDEQAASSEFSALAVRSGNAYTYAEDGYDPYLFGNLSITKEIGERVSLSFYANNFTFSRQSVTSYATGIATIFVPSFYYGLTCRMKF